MIRSQNPGPCEGFDEYAGKRWIYPNNMTIRGYQKAAVELALLNNAMIVLPTGFGKTFIAAVVMYNFYLWYPRGKIIFVAPTRPLVTQQIEECRRISGIPASDSVELTGKITSERRAILWETKRVFFATPQVIDNDLNTGLLPARYVRCIVIDEAHRAQGGYAYVNILRYLHDNNQNGFRVLALSATPGSDITRVQQVMLNLYINEVMFRSESSIDLMQFSNSKNSKAWTVELTGKHRELVDMFIDFTRPIFKDLHRAGLIWNYESIERIPKYCLVKAMTTLKNNEVQRTGMSKGKLMMECAAAVALTHKFELLTLYGLRTFYSNCMNAVDDQSKAFKMAVAGKPDYDKIIAAIECIFGDEVRVDPMLKPKKNLTQGHPKLVVVKDILTKHFADHEGHTETRAIIFTKYRESVFDIVQTLKAYEPLIKPTPFVGQGDKAGARGGMKQRDQIDMINRFKAGEFNVLVATCVAEEGLDIGEVDLIICYDTSSSPICTTQRRGRTGRKRSGNVQTICTKGYEEKKLMEASRSRRQVEDQLFKKDNYTNYRYRDAPRMVPLHITPLCLEQRIEPVMDDTPRTTTTTPKRGKRRVQEEVPSSKKKLKCDEMKSQDDGNGNGDDDDDDTLWSDDDDDIFKSVRLPVVAAAAACEKEENI